MILNQLEYLVAKKKKKKGEYYHNLPEYWEYQIANNSRQ